MAELRLRYTGKHAPCVVTALPNAPLLRVAPATATASRLLRAIARLDESDSVILNHSLAKLDSTQLRARIPYIRLSDPTRRARSGTLRSWITRVARLKSQYGNTAMLTDAVRYLRALGVDPDLDEKWERLSDEQQCATDVALALAIHPKALLLDGRAATPQLEVRVLALTKHVPLLWDGCAPETAAACVDARSFEPLMLAKRDLPPLEWRTHSIGECRVPAVLVALAAAASTAAGDSDARGAVIRVAEIAAAEVRAVTDIPWWRIAALGVVLLGVILVSAYLEMGIASQVTISAVRCFVQLGSLGLILVPIIHGNQPVVVLLYIAFMMVIAAIEASSRTPYTFPGLFYVCCAALFVNVLAMGLLLFTVVLGTGLDAQYVIPILGMVAGNALSSVSVGVSQIVSVVSESTEGVEALLALGASRWEASKDVVRNAIMIGLVPLLNRMSVTGLVAIPGTMTGQIIGGTSPGLAARYQLVVMYAIAGTTVSSILTSSLLTIYCLTDTEHRIRRERLEKRHNDPGFFGRIQRSFCRSRQVEPDSESQAPQSSQLTNHNNGYGATSSTVL